VPENCQRENKSSPLRWCPQSPAHLESGAISRKIAATGLKAATESETS